MSLEFFTLSKSSRLDFKVYRFQSGHDGMEKKNLVPRYAGLIKGFRDIYKAEGWDGLYRGIHITMFTQAIANAIFFMM